MASFKRSTMALMVTSLLVVAAFAQSAAAGRGNGDCIRQQDGTCNNAVCPCDGTGRPQRGQAPRCGYGQRGWTGRGAGNQGGSQQQILDMGTLTDIEVAHTLFMRQEEKLARDVYLTFDDMYLADVFATIAGSEQRHMDAMGRIIEIQELVDPVADDTVGAFAEPEDEGDTDFGALYATLTTDGAESYVAALRTGAFIEELDILDLEDCLLDVTNEYLAQVLNNLMRGSRNHLRAFVAALQAAGETYTPQLMEQSEYDAIVGSSVERGGRNR
jgi:hypothetical protein